MKHHKIKECNKHINAHRFSNHQIFHQKCWQFVGVWPFLKGTHLYKNIHHFKHSILHLGHSKTLYSFFNKYRAGIDLRLTWHSSCESTFEASSVVYILWELVHVGLWKMYFFTKVNGSHLHKQDVPLYGFCTFSKCYTENNCWWILTSPKQQVKKN